MFTETHFDKLLSSFREYREERKTEFEWLKSHHGLANKQDLKELEHLIMTAIELLRDFAAKQTAFNTRQGTAIDGLVTGLAGVSGDVDTLVAKITELQNSAGPATPEDQKLIDDLETAGEAASTKLESLSTALAELDAKTPPAPPAP